jgi:hypothetical protein
LAGIVVIISWGCGTENGAIQMTTLDSRRGPIIVVPGQKGDFEQQQCLEICRCCFRLLRVIGFDRIG